MVALLFFAVAAFMIISCHKSALEVVVYTSVDKVFSEPIFQEFEQKTGIKVKAVYDIESAKTVGLVNRMIAEKDNPQADLFWSSEVAGTIILRDKEVLSPYCSPSASDIPAQFKDQACFWTGFAARERVLIYNKNLLSDKELPDSILKLTDPVFKGKVALANPMFGTTFTQCAALFVALGEENAKKYFEGLKANGVKIVDGNANSRDAVARGESAIGFTDTDDAHYGVMEGRPVRIIFPDQGGIGTLLIPNTVALLKGGPNPSNAQKLIDYLLSKEVERKLAFSDAWEMPVRDGVDRPKEMPSYKDVKAMNISYEAIAKAMPATRDFLQKTFVEE